MQRRRGKGADELAGREEDADADGVTATSPRAVARPTFREEPSAPATGPNRNRGGSRVFWPEDWVWASTETAAAVKVNITRVFFIVISPVGNYFDASGVHAPKTDTALPSRATETTSIPVFSLIRKL